MLAAQQGDSLQAAAVLEKLCRTYWYPLHVFIRRFGHDDETAKDLTQGFFEASVKHFLANQRDRANTTKRDGAYAFVPWDEATLENQVLLEALPDLLAEKSYERQWALTLLDQVFARLREECVLWPKRTNHCAAGNLRRGWIGGWASAGSDSRVWRRWWRKLRVSSMASPGSGHSLRGAESNEGETGAQSP